MQRHSTASISIAPLQIRKSSNQAGARGETADTAIFAQDGSSLRSPTLPRARFHNYLRAVYPFEPTPTASPTTVTLPLNAGDIVLIHSVHTNGWADGTLLETGERGWLPTNYCEAYDYVAMRPLLRSLTDFWDIVRMGSESNLAIFQTKDYMRGLVAGVRYLLERCDCLTRDSPNVCQHDAIRRTRKGVLSDLSSLVKAGKQLQLIVPLSSTLVDLDHYLDELLLHAFRIVSRAVKLYDVWSEEMTLLHVLHAPDPMDFALRATDAAESSGLSETATLTKIPSTPSSNRHTGSTARYPSDPLRSQSQSTPTDNKRASTTHRMSYSARATADPNVRLASAQLNQCYDAFLGVLASFLGTHMQSRSSSELLLTTQQAVKSCRQLLAVIEMVIDREIKPLPALVECKDSMYDAITELYLAAKEVFRPFHSLDDELAYLPEQSQRLVDAATNCVSVAGRCVTRAKTLLEDGGDFEISPTQDNRSSDSDNDDASDRSSDSAFHLSPDADPTSRTSHAYRGHPTPRPPVVGKSLPDIPLSRNSESPAMRDRKNSPLPPTPSDDIHPFIRSPSSQATLQSALVDRPASGEVVAPVGHLRHKSMARAVIHSTSSDSTFDSSLGTPDPSNLSIASTRVTSFTESVCRRFASQESLAQGSDLVKDEAEGEEAVLERTFAHELLFNRDGTIVGGSLNAVVERLTAHDSTPDGLFVSTIYLTFRLFAKPIEFVDALILRFRYAGESPRLAGPVRLRVYNAFKGWLESHWRHDCDDAALPAIVAFAREELMPVLHTAGKRLLELAEVVGSTHVPAVPRVVSAIGKTSTSWASYVSNDTQLPPPVLSKSQLTALRTWKMGGASVGILDFDPLELARQITLKTSQIFCSILPEELLATEWTKQSSSLAVNVRAMSTLSTDLSNLVADSILQLEEPKKRAAIIKQWIKIANKCLELCNYDTVWAIVCSLDSTNIKRMLKTWDAVPQKNKNQFEELRKVCDISRNYSTLRQLLQNQVPPCLPFLGVYLTDLTFVDHGNPAKRQLSQESGSIEVINLDKHTKTAKIISDLQRFQIPYRLTEVSELQTWMQDQLIRVRSAGEKNFQNHYRRSLILEPREQMKPGVSPIGKEKFDMLGWMHLTKDKSVTVGN
ncbi:hypothetical protein DV737_g5036, partial [Chaetothyriales sp. CBS 132003]